METKYYMTWEEYVEEHQEIDEKVKKVMEPKMQSYEDLMFNFVMNLFL